MRRKARSQELSMMRGRSAKRSVGRRVLAERGQSVAEMALITPVLLLLLVGTIEIGRFAYYGIEVSNAARAGVQYGAQSLMDSKDVAGITQAARNDAPEVATMNVKATNRCACSNSPANFVGCPARGCSPGHALVFLQVDTTANIQPLFRYPGLPASFTTRGQAIMRVMQ
jgi:Flp pilus assembly protein TadG